MIILIVSVIFLIFGLYLNYQFKLFVPSSRKLRVLEYHSVSDNGFEDQITLSKEKFINQLKYLKENGYQTFVFSELENFEKNNLKLPSKSIVLTFDDGFPDNYDIVLPLLKEFNFKAVCFLVLGRIGRNIDWPGKYVRNEVVLLDKNKITEMSSHFEFGYHTFKHDNYSKMSLEEIQDDLNKCNEVIKKENLNVFPVLAYTYGKFYKKKDEKQKRFFDMLNKSGIKYALRIGNRINIFPFKSKYQIERIDIRGNENMDDFKKRLQFGRKKIF